MNIYKKIAEQKKYLEDLGYNVLYIGLYGSQNYNLDDENSDIDLRAVILPTLEQIIKRDIVSKKYETNIGDIDVKDVFTYYDVVKKGNFSFIEPMQTQWFIGDKYLRELFGKTPLNYMSCKGDMYSKAKVFRHPYPSKEKEISKWGYDPKQLHHIFRLLDLLELKDESISYLKYDKNNKQRQWLYDIKKNKNDIIETLHSAKYIDISTVDTIKSWIDENTKQIIPTNYKYKPVEIKDDIVKYIINKLKVDIFKTPITSAREYRTFSQGIPKNDLSKFAELKKYKNKDISYIVYETLEIL